MFGGSKRGNRGNFHSTESGFGREPLGGRGGRPIIQNTFNRGRFSFNPSSGNSNQISGSFERGSELPSRREESQRENSPRGVNFGNDRGFLRGRGFPSNINFSSNSDFPSPRESQGVKARFPRSRGNFERHRDFPEGRGDFSEIRGDFLQTREFTETRGSIRDSPGGRGNQRGEGDFLRGSEDFQRSEDFSTNSRNWNNSGRDYINRSFDARTNNFAKSGDKGNLQCQNLDTLRVSSSSGQENLHQKRDRSNFSRDSFEPPSFEPPRGNFQPPRVKFEPPRGNSEHQRRGFEPPRGDFESPRGNFESPRGNFEHLKSVFETPRDNFESPIDKSSRDSFQRSLNSRGDSNSARGAGRVKFTQRRGLGPFESSFSFNGEGNRGNFTGNRGHLTGNRGNLTGNRRNLKRNRGNFTEDRGNFDREDFANITGNRNRGNFAGNRESFTGNRDSFRGNRESFTGNFAASENFSNPTISPFVANQFVANPFVLDPIIASQFVANLLVSNLFSGTQISSNRGHRSPNMARGGFRGRFNRGRGGFSHDRRGNRGMRGGRGGWQDGQSRNKHIQNKSVVQEQLKETDVGITEFISDLDGFSGVLKARFSDFHVNEINECGEIAKLTSTEIPSAFVAETVAPKEIDYTNLKSPVEEIPEDKWKEIVSLIDAPEEKIVALEVTNLSKECRREIHNTVKRIFKSKITANTISKDENKFMQFKKFNKDDIQDTRMNWPADLGEHVHFVVYKEAMDTLTATYKIADALKMRAALFAYAGVKDKRAKTTQWFSIRKTDPNKILNSTKNLKSLHIGNFTFKPDALKLGHLKGNRFRIALRNVTGEDDLIDKAMTSLQKNGFINYYGLQRFGNDKEVPTSDVGLQLMLGNWKEACNLILKPKASDDPFSDITQAKKIFESTKNAQKARDAFRKNRNKCVEAKLLSGMAKANKNDYVNALESIPRNMRLLYIHSFQSLVWNKLVSRRIKEFGMKPVVGDLVLVNGDFDDEGLLLLEGGEEADTGAQLLSDDQTSIAIDLSDLKPSNKKIKKSTPWMTDDLMKLINKKDKIHSLVKKDPLNERLKLEYKAMRNRITAEIRKAKNEYYGAGFSTRKMIPDSVENPYEEISEDQWKELIDLFSFPDKTVELNLGSISKDLHEEIEKYILESFKEQILVIVERSESGIVVFKCTLNPNPPKEEIVDPKTVENVFPEDINAETWSEIISVLEDPEKVVKLDMAHLSKDRRKDIHLYINRSFRNRISSITVSDGGTPKYMSFKKNTRLPDRKNVPKNEGDSGENQEVGGENTDGENLNGREEALDEEDMSGEMDVSREMDESGETAENENLGEHAASAQSEDKGQTSTNGSKSTTGATICFSPSKYSHPKTKQGEFPEVKVLTEDDLSSYTILDIVMPLPGYGITYPDNCKEWYKEILESYGLKLEMPKQRAKTYTLSGTYRKIVSKVQDLSWKTIKYDDPNSSLIRSDYEELIGEKEPEDVPEGKYKALIVDFCLSSSCYATMALREILKMDTSSSSHAKLNNYHETKSQTTKVVEESTKMEVTEDTKVSKRKSSEEGETVSKKIKLEVEEKAE